MCGKDKALARCRLCRYAWHVQTALYALSCGAVAVSHDLNPNPKVLFRTNISYSSSLLCLLPWRTQDVHANGKDGMTEDLQFVPQCPTEQMLHFISCWKLLDVAQGCLVSAVLQINEKICADKNVKLHSAVVSIEGQDCDCQDLHWSMVCMCCELHADFIYFLWMTSAIPGSCTFIRTSQLNLLTRLCR